MATDAYSTFVPGFPTFIVYKDGERVDHFNASSRATFEEYAETIDNEKTLANYQKQVPGDARLVVSKETRHHNE